MPTPLVRTVSRARPRGPRRLMEVLEQGVLGAMHRRGGADHHEPHEEVARDLVDAVEGGAAGKRSTTWTKTAAAITARISPPS